MSKFSGSPNKGNNGNGRHRGILPTEKPKDMGKTLKRILRYIGSFKTQLILIVIFGLIYTVCSLSANVFIKGVVNSFGELNNGIFTKDPNHDDFIKNIISLGVAYLGYIIFLLFTRLASCSLTVKVTRKLRDDMFSRIVKLPIKYTDTHKHGDIMSRVVNDVSDISDAISNGLVSIITGLVTIIGCLGIMLYYSPLLTLVSLFVMGLTLTFSLLISKSMAPLRRTQSATLGKLNSDAEEMITGSKTVKAYNRQEYAIKAFNEKSDELARVGCKANIIGGSMGPCMNFVGNLGYFLVCIIGSLLAINGIGGFLGGALNAGIVVMFLTTVKQFNRPINEIAELFSQFVAALAGAERVFEIMDEEEENFEGKIPFDGSKIRGIIDFNHIGFAYVEDKPVLNDFNVDVKSGHKIALVGATGSGKTTIVNLLLRFYDINTGKITIDGVDIADISKKDLRSCISIVLQDPVLFNDTVENNIKYGREDASDEDVDKALEFANCSKMVARLPEGKKTILTEGASNISQGQRQLLTIARAVLANPKILILDEATSSVDTRTEKKIQDAMVKLMKNRTSIIIAHRLSTIADADLIVVLDKGKVVEMGNQDELIKKDGVYNKLYQAQFSGREI